jgi:hypothetical protein
MEGYEDTKETEEGKKEREKERMNETKKEK